MQKIDRCPISTFACVASAAVAMLGCAPKYDWREVRGPDGGYSIDLPAKAATFARPINLDGVQLAMTMTAAEVDGVTFAVGHAQLTDASAARAALDKMKTALVKNINGSIQHETRSVPGTRPTIDIEASGNRNGQPYLLVARFAANDTHAYQVIVVGREKAVAREAVDTFLTSFKLN